MRVLSALLAAIALCGLYSPASAGSPIPCESVIQSKSGIVGSSSSVWAAVAVESDCKRMYEEDAAQGASPELRFVLRQWRAEVFKDKPFFSASVYLYSLAITNPHCERSASYAISVEDAFENSRVWNYLQEIKSSVISLPPRTSVTLEFLSPLPPEENVLHVGEELTGDNGNWLIYDHGKVRVAVPKIDESVSDKSPVFFSLPPHFGPAQDLEERNPMFGKCKTQ